MSNEIDMTAENDRKLSCPVREDKEDTLENNINKWQEVQKSQIIIEVG
jgi:hypothetical protein